MWFPTGPGNARLNGSREFPSNYYKPIIAPQRIRYRRPQDAYIHACVYPHLTPLSIPGLAPSLRFSRNYTPPIRLRESPAAAFASLRRGIKKAYNCKIDLL